MKKGLLDILACPEDKAALTLQVEEEVDDEVLVGTLTCTECGFPYPVEAGIPNLLPQEFHTDQVTD